MCQPAPSPVPPTPPCHPPASHSEAVNGIQGAAGSPCLMQAGWVVGVPRVGQASSKYIRWGLEPPSSPNLMILFSLQPRGQRKKYVQET